MFSFLFFLAFFLIIIIALLITKWCGIKLLFPSILSVFIWFYLVFAYIGILPLMFYWDEYRYVIGVNDQLLILKLWIYSSLSLLLIISGFIFSRHILKMKHKSNGIVNSLSVNVERIIFIIFIICLLVFIIYISKIPSIPIISLLTGSSTNEIKVMRSLATNAFEGKFHWYMLFLTGILPFITFISFSSLLKKFTWIRCISFLSIFMVTAFVAVMNTEKAPIIWLLIGIFVTYMITKNKSFNLKEIVTLSIVAFPILIIMYQQFMGLKGQSILVSIQAILSRTFTGSISPAYFYLQMFPSEYDFLLGKSLPNPMGIFPWEHFRITVEVMNYVFPHLQEMGITGSMPTVFWAEMYANFGFGGIVISSLLLGVYLYLIQHIIMNIDKNPLTIGLYTWLILEFVKLTESGFSMFILNIDLITIFLLSVFLYLIDKKSKGISGRINYEKSIVYSASKL